MQRWWKWLLLLGVLIGGGAALATPGISWWQKRAAHKFVTAKISRGRVETVVNSTGTIKPVRTVSVGAFISGPIKKVYVDFNSEITEKHQDLALIDDRLWKATVDRDRASVHTAEAELKRIEALREQASRNMARAENLKKANADYISATESDQFRYTYLSLLAQEKLAQAAIDQAKATLRNSEQNLSYTRIKAPDEIDPEKGIKGVVIERKVDEGQTVAASFQTPELFVIGLGMDKQMHVYASADEADIGMIEMARRQDRIVKFTVDAHPGELFTGKIKEIRKNSTTTQNVVTYPVVVVAENRDQKLLPGMTANLTFQIEAKENVTRVPVSALRFVPLATQAHPEDRHYLEAATSGGRTAAAKAEQSQNRRRRLVWVQEGEWLRAVPVTLGLMEYQFAELISGELSEGKMVVTGTEGALAPR